MGNTTIITGKIQIYGTEPHTFVGILDDNGTEYAVYSPLYEQDLRRLQGHIIEFTVVLLDEPKNYGGLFLKGGTVIPIIMEGNSVGSLHNILQVMPILRCCCK